VAECKFCKREFGSLQAVRAHLKACVPYRQSFGRAVPGSPQAPVPQGSVPQGRIPSREIVPEGVGHSSLSARVRDQVEAERLGLKLRQLQGAHYELDLRVAVSQRPAEAERERQAELEREGEEREQRFRLGQNNLKLRAKERRNAEIARAELDKRRRTIVQQVKDQVLRESPYGVPGALKADALLEIEAAFRGEAVEDLPLTELLTIARGARDDIYAPWLEERERDSAIRAAKPGLVSYGKGFAEERIKNLSSADRLECRLFVGSELQEQLSGDESKADVRELVVELVEEFLEG